MNENKSKLKIEGILTKILETTKDGFWLINSEGRFEDVNETYLKMTQYSRDEIIGMRINDLDYLESDEDTKDRIKRIIEKGTETFETKQKRKDGTVFDIEMSVSYVPEYNRFICFGRDITRRKRTEEALEQRLLSLTLPLTDDRDIDFEDLFNLDDLQKLQNEFSDATGVASIITKNNGTPITQPSNFCFLCRDLIRKTKEGLFNCYRSDAILGRAREDGPTVQPCLSGGLWDAGAAIKVEGKHIANWLIGQVRDQTQSEDRIRDYAIKIGIDPDKAAKAFHEVPSMSKEKFEKISQALYTLANQLSNIAYQNIQQARFIADIKKAEEQLRNSEEQKRTLLENSLDGVYYRHNGVYEFVNKRYSEITGYTEKELMDPNFDFNMMFFEEDKAFIADRIEKRKKGIKISPRFRMGLKRKNGERVEIETYIRHEDRDGELISTGFVKDITEMIKAERKLKESERKYRGLFRQSNDAIFLIDTDGNHIDANDKAIEMLGYSLEELKEMSYKDTIVKEAQNDSKNRINNIINGTSYKRYEKSFIDRSGNTIPTEISVSPIKNQQGEVIYILSIVRDISERKQFESDLIIAKEKAEESDRLKSAFLANTSHEIRTPMNGILGFIQLLKDPKLDGDEIKEYISIIEKSGKRMLNILNDIIDISKIEAGQIQNYITAVDINTTINDIYNFFRQEAKDRNIALELSIPKNTSNLEIYTDKDKLTAIFTNLIKNSLKFTDKGKIQFGYNNENNQIIFFVEDTGIGMPDDKKQIIFERFVQIDHGKDRVYDGAGLGLSITKAYIDMLCGEIWFDSEFDKGTTFSFTLPSIPELNIDSEIVYNAQKIKKTDNSKILIVEDDEVSNILLQKILTRNKYDFISVKNGIDAVDNIRKRDDIKIVLMDIKMPEMNGYESLSKIREFNSKVIIIAQTAYASEDDEQKALDSGFDDYIFKPVEEKTLIEKIEKHL